MSTSLIFADQKPTCCPDIGVPVYGGSAEGAQGVIFRPGHTTRILCGAPTDLSNRKCGEMGWCRSIPLGSDHYDPRIYHSPKAADGCPEDSSAWLPSDFGPYLHRTNIWMREMQATWAHRYDYNEILIDGGFWFRRLPDAVEAFFGDGQLVRREHATFLRKYGLTASQVPRLRFNPHSWNAPFANVRLGP